MPEPSGAAWNFWRLGLGGSPVVRQKFGKSRNGMICDAGENILEPGERIDSDALTGGYETPQHRGGLAALSLPKNIQLLRPTAMPRIARSVALLSIWRSPSSQ